MKKKQGAPGAYPSGGSPASATAAMDTLLLCLCIAVLMAVVLLCDTLEEENGWRMDFSFNELTTQSETTEAILASLPYDVHIYALFTPGSEDLPLMELLNRYASASDRVTWEPDQRYPESHPDHPLPRHQRPAPYQRFPHRLLRSHRAVQDSLPGQLHQPQPGL